MGSNSLVAGALRDEGYEVAECGGVALIVGDADSDAWYVVRLEPRPALSSKPHLRGLLEVKAYSGAVGDLGCVLRSECSEAAAVAEILAHDRGV